MHSFLISSVYDDALLTSDLYRFIYKERTINMH
jgi:hypothetical protein